MGAQDAGAAAPQYDFVFEDTMDFVKADMLAGEREGGEREREGEGGGRREEGLVKAEGIGGAQGGRGAIRAGRERARAACGLIATMATRALGHDAGSTPLLHKGSALG